MSKAGIRLKKNKVLDMVWHEESTLVFNKDKFVIGRFEDNKLVSLDQQAVDLCDQYKFRYDNSLLPKAEEEDEEDEDGEEVDAEEDGNEETVSVEAVLDSNSEPSDIQKEEIAEVVESQTENVYTTVESSNGMYIFKSRPIRDILSQLSEQVYEEYNNMVLHYNNIVTDQQNQLCEKDKIISKLEEEKNALSEKLKAISKFLS